MKKNKQKIINSPQLLIMFTFITTLIVIVLSISRYKSTVAGSSTGRVAQYVLGIQTNNELAVPINKIRPNNSQEFYFEIVNEENNSKNEVTLKYTIELENKANLPLVFILYKYDENTSEYKEVKLSANVTEEFEMNVKNEVNHKYKVNVKWKDNTTDSNYDSYKYSKTIDYLKVIVNAVQVD